MASCYNQRPSFVSHRLSCDHGGSPLPAARPFCVGQLASYENQKRSLPGLSWAMQGLGTHGMGEWAHARSERIIEGLSRPISDLRGPASGACGSNSFPNESLLKKRLPFYILDRRGSHDFWGSLERLCSYIYTLLTKQGTFIEMEKIGTPMS